jgi:tRNA1(Val) A37 N6-methylase TrmN6
VRASLAAAAATQRQLRVYAVEKNTSAVVHIQALVASQGWQEVVTIVGQDMRHWQPPELVSGGWGRTGLWRWLRLLVVLAAIS